MEQVREAEVGSLVESNERSPGILTHISSAIGKRTRVALAALGLFAAAEGCAHVKTEHNNKKTLTFDLRTRDYHRRLMLNARGNPSCQKILSSNVFNPYERDTQVGFLQIEKNIESCEDDILKLEAFYRLGKWYEEDENDFQTAARYYRAVIKLADRINKLLGPFDYDLPSYYGSRHIIWKYADSFFAGIAMDDGAIYTEVRTEATKRLQRIDQQKSDQQKLEQLSNDPEVQKFREKMATAFEAEKEGDYERAFFLFEQARYAGANALRVFENAKIAVPEEIDNLARQVVFGMRRNQGKTKIARSQPEQQRSGRGNAIGDLTWEDIIRGGQKALPYIGKVVTALERVMITMERIAPGSISGIGRNRGAIEVKTPSGVYCGYDVIVKNYAGVEHRCRSKDSCSIDDLNPGEYKVTVKSDPACNEDPDDVGPMKVKLEPNSILKIDVRPGFGE